MKNSSNVDFPTLKTKSSELYEEKLLNIRRQIPTTDESKLVLVTFLTQIQRIFKI